VGDSSNRASSQDREGGLVTLGTTRRRHFPSILQRCKYKEVGIVSVGDIFTRCIRTLKDFQFDDWRRVNWATVGTGLESQQGIEMADNEVRIHLAPEPQARARSGC